MTPLRYPPCILPLPSTSNQTSGELNLGTSNQLGADQPQNQHPNPPLNPIPPQPKISTNFDRPSSCKNPKSRSNAGEHLNPNNNMISTANSDPANSIQPNVNVESAQTTQRQGYPSVGVSFPQQADPSLNINSNSNPIANNPSSSKTPIRYPNQISKPSFAATITSSLSNSLKGKALVEVSHGTHMGKPAIYFSAKDYFVNLVEDCKLTLVARFIRGKPKMDELRKLFVSHIPLKGTVKIAYFDHSQVYMDFTNESDYNHVYFRIFLHMGPSSMKIVTWTPDFVPGIETSLAPVWILIHQLPWHLFR